MRYFKNIALRVFAAFIIVALLFFPACKQKNTIDPFCELSIKVKSEKFYKGCTIPISVQTGGGSASESQLRLFINDRDLGIIPAAPEIFYFKTDSVSSDQLSIQTIYSSSEFQLSDEKTIALLPTSTNCPDSVIDIDGNTYSVKQIGNQCWTTENIKSRRYPDGLELINGIDSALIGGPAELPGWYFAYQRKISNVDTYGYLYTWSSALKGTKAENGSNKSIQGICPDGWHIPSADEWWELIDYLGGDQIAGNKLKENGTSHWIDNLPATDNESGFKALPGGARISAGSYYQKGVESYFWSSTETIPNHAFHLLMQSTSTKAHVLGHQDSKRWGYSVRCVKDSSE